LLIGRVVDCQALLIPYNLQSITHVGQTLSQICGIALNLVDVCFGAEAGSDLTKLHIKAYPINSNYALGDAHFGALTCPL